MITYCFLYKDLASLHKIIDEQNIDIFLHYLIEIYTTSSNQEEAIVIKDTIIKTFPNSSIFGASTGGVVYNGEKYDDQTLVIIKYFESCTFKISKCDLSLTTYYDLAEYVDKNSVENSSMIHIMFSEYLINIDKFLIEYNKKNPNTKMFGGIAGHIKDDEIKPFIFDHTGILTSYVLFISYSNNLMVSNNIHVSSRCITNEYVLTKKENEFWIEIDDTPIFEWFQDNLAITKFNHYPKVEDAIKFDEFLQVHLSFKDEKFNNRFFLYNKEVNQVSNYYSDIPEGSQFKLAYTSAEKSIEEVKGSCKLFTTAPIESIFYYSCIFRKYHVNNIFKIDVSPFTNINICGVFLFGEIANKNQKNLFLNCSASIVSMAENEKYIQMDCSVLNSYKSLIDNNDSLVNNTILKNNDKMVEKNQYLSDRMEQILLNENNISYIYPYYNMPNYFKYIADCTSNPYDKICLLKIGNYDILEQYLGKERYFKLLKKLIYTIDKDIRDNKQFKNISVYGIQEDKFIFAADDSFSKKEFLEFCQYSFEKYNSIIIDNINIIITFVVVLNCNNLLEVALNKLKEKKFYTNYLICDNENIALNSFEEIQMIHILEEAIKQDAIIPYYQPIYDSKLSIITKYEALMRIVLESKVYYPEDFLKVAKKYNLYNVISEIMMEKVMKDFESKKEMVSLNISMYDIKSEHFIHKFSNLLNKYQDTNLCIEITEEENYENMEELEYFFNILRNHDIKIAIDDFGKGYSNLLNVLSIAPDYIKIDGDIIKNINKEENVKLLKTIMFLGKQFEVDLIAEYVETKEINNYLSDIGIAYLQGYFISKPKLFDEL